MRRYLILLVVLTLSGCAIDQPEERPFFQKEYATETHGRKTFLDRLVETDPGGFRVKVAPEYETNPPERLAFFRSAILAVPIWSLIRSS
jgi:hypothetical protein